ncbi:MAG: prohibitin family protein [Leptospiraceae bacterium]|nr:prohibitin family protein [Leptospiraceae bacterium]
MAEVSTQSKLVIKIVLGVVALVIILVLNPFVVIGAGERGIILNFGAVSDNILGEGLHFRMPIVQRVVPIDVKVKKKETNSAAASKDLQNTQSVIALNYHLDPGKVNKIYQELGLEFEDRIISPAVQEVVKAVTAKFTAGELITQREEVGKEIRDQLRDRLAPFSIIVDALSIIDFQFSEQFVQAIESKIAAEQFALKAKQDLERIKIEAEQKITSARAEAEGLRLQKGNVTRELVQLRQIEATLKAIEKWNGQLPKVTGGAMPFVNVDQLQ